jgi:RHH-type transcriptional regulator, proline utilization regulon repressor / proline dehydrogenase / delta 1-pyrroline-5-carboxylate dehydrogenase
VNAPADFTPPLQRGPLREAITSLTRRPEPELLPGLLDAARLEPAEAAAAQTLALQLAGTLRERKLAFSRAGLVQGLLQEFALSSQEGVALMCLAEALLRIPDAATRDALIRDKVSRGDWRAHLGSSPSMFVNAAAWGLLLTGKLVATHSDQGLGAALMRVVGRGGEPLVRKGVDLTMRLMGEQFVIGESITQALVQAREREAQGFRHSYDMLGEAALTESDAARYLAAYEQAIDAIGAAAAGRGIHDGPGISIKLSALHPRYARAQVQRVQDELYPRLRSLALSARAHDIGLNIDAEESERLELSLDLLERLCHEPALADWHGIGFVIQAYGKRCPAVIDWLVDLGSRSGHRLMVRLVKGAYWDSEIKRAQLDGQAGYPVYTRKAYTDVAYLACARKLLAAPLAVFPQFATHNAHTLAAVCSWPVVLRPARGATSSSACTAWARRCTSRWWRRPPPAAWAAPAASMRRWARTRRCWPTWCAGCWRTAPTPPSCTASPMRRCRWKNWWKTRCAPCSTWPNAKARWACRIRRSRCRLRCTARNAPTPWGWTWSTKRLWPPSRQHSPTATRSTLTPCR